MSDNNKKKKPSQNDNRKRNITGIVTLVIWALILTIFGNYVLSRTEATGSVEIYFSELITMVESDQVEEVMLESGKYTVTLTEEGESAWLEEYYAEQGYSSVPEDAEMPTLYTTPLSYTDFLVLLQEHGVAYYSPYQQSSVLSEILISYVLPMAIMLLVMVLFYRFAMSGRMGGGGIGNVGKSNAKVYVEKSTGVTFRDVAGQDEAKESLEEIIDFLHNPGKYTAIGARLPKGA
ncbi:MAG: cell division protein FtsH, partial [Clostridiales bacterium]|nr:cell division protein FtsH [Clostridiales bacterium]